VAYIFEWHATKASANVRKHGVSFDEASTAFADPLALLMPDPDHSQSEERHVLLGMVNSVTALGGSLFRAPAADAADLGPAGDLIRAEAI